MESLIRLIGLLLVSILAGTSFGIWMTMNPSHYTQTVYLEILQQMVRSMNRVMVTLVVLATLFSLFSAFLQRFNKVQMYLWSTAAFFLIVCMVITRFGNVPIQEEFLKMSSGNLPENWISLRDSWWTFHILRTLSELLALFFICWTFVRSK